MNISLDGHLFALSGQLDSLHIPRGEGAGCIAAIPFRQPVYVGLILKGETNLGLASQIFYCLTMLFMLLNVEEKAELLLFVQF